MTRRRKVMLWVGIPVLLLGGAFAAWRIWLNQELSDAKARMRAAGYPVTAEELNAYYPTPTGANAAEVYARAFEAMKGPRPEEMEEFKDADAQVQYELTEERRVLLAEYLEKNAQAIQILREAGASKEARFPVDFRDGMAMLPLEHLAKLRDSARLLAWDVRDAVHRNDAERAGESLGAILGIVESLKNEPTIISQMIRLAIAGIAADVLDDILGGVGLPARQVAARVERLKAMQFRDDLVRAMAAERAMALIFTEELVGQEDYSADSTRLLVQMHPALARTVDWFGEQSGVSELQLLFYLELYELVLEDMALPFYESGPAWGEIDARLSSAGPLLGALAQIALPAVSYVSEAPARGDAYVQSMLLAIAADRFYRDTSRIPATALELVPEYVSEIPTDPYDGQPMRYRSGEDYFVVYSVGRGLADDGGDVISERHQPEDVGLLVEYGEP